MRNRWITWWPAFTAPFITHETARAAQSLNSPGPGRYLIVSDEGSDFVISRWPSASLYDYPPQEQWNAFQKLAQMLMHTPFNAEGIVTKIFTDANGTQHIGLHPIPDRPPVALSQHHAAATDDAG
ncbi:IgaA/UmoB family intracellular growth attenuator [Shigella sonnei]